LEIDETLAMQTGSGTAAQTDSYLTDALNSTIRLTDGNGNKLVDYTYSAYGVTTAGASNANPIQYTGRENDGVACLYYYRARYYSPCLNGRFISQDPMGLRAGINGYVYANGNPLQYRDPSGKIANVAEAAIVGVASGIVGGFVNLGEQSGNLSNINGWAAFGAGFAGGFVGDFTGSATWGGLVSGVVTNGLTTYATAGSSGLDVAGSTIFWRHFWSWFWWSRGNDW
jgi:RHS repeat-associated protein